MTMPRQGRPSSGGVPNLKPREPSPAGQSQTQVHAVLRQGHNGATSECSQSNWATAAEAKSSGGRGTGGSSGPAAGAEGILFLLLGMDGPTARILPA